MIENSVAHKNKAECCGCGNCANICPKNAITMIADEEGYEYPSVDENLCIDCGACIKKCPFEKKYLGDKHYVIESYAGRYNDEHKVKMVSSGGVCSALSESFIANGGFVYGAVYSKDYKYATIERISDSKGIIQLKGSKYFQTIKGESVKQIKKDLLEGRKVLFIGMPCDVAAVKRYTGEHESLYTVDIICSGVPSPLAHRQFIEHLEKRNGSITDFTYRRKKHGWHWPYIEAYANDKIIYSKPWSASLLGYSFKMMMRPSCYNCLYKDNRNDSDLTVGDFWGLSPKDTRYYSNGVSAIMSRSEKGEKLVTYLNGFSLFPATYEEIANNNPKLLTCAIENSMRTKFAEQLAKEGVITACKSCMTVKDRIANIVKIICATFNINLK